MGGRPPGRAYADHRRGGQAGPRAQANLLETFPFFAAAVLAAALSAKLGPLTLWGSALYVAARALYVPIYAFGVSIIRSVAWTVLPWRGWSW